MTDLMTVQQYKELKGKILTNTTEDTRIGKLIEGISTAIKEYIGRSLIDYYSDYKVEYKKGTLNSFLVSEWPIKDTEIVVAYKTSAGYIDLQEDIDFYVDAPNGLIMSANGNNFAKDSVRDPKFLRITYKGGFASCPKDILVAMADYVEKAMKQEHSIQKSMGGQDIMNFPTTPIGRLPTHIAVVLDTYRVPIL